MGRRLVCSMYERCDDLKMYREWRLNLDFRILIYGRIDDEGTPAHDYTVSNAWTQRRWVNPADFVDERGKVELLSFATRVYDGLVEDDIRMAPYRQTFRLVCCMDVGIIVHEGKLYYTVTGIPPYLLLDYAGTRFSFAYHFSHALQTSGIIV